jgi:RNA polymerase sigma-70 factor (ECF subfamily)
MDQDDLEFRRLINQHESMVFSIALRLLGDHGLAEEVAQDCFVELHKSLPRLESAEHIRFWLRRVAVHRATDAMRRRAVRPESHAESWGEEHDRAPETGRHHGMELRVESVLMSLPPASRIAIVLRYQEEMRPDDIAVLLGQPVATVKSNLQRGLGLLRRKADVMLKEFVRE